MITHDGVHIPTDPTGWDPDQVEWVTFAWADQADVRQGIATSTWVLPDGWTKDDERTDVTAETKDGVDKANCNQALLHTDAEKGKYTITNRVTFGDGTELDRSVHVIVKPT